MKKLSGCWSSTRALYGSSVGVILHLSLFIFIIKFGPFYIDLSLLQAWTKWGSGECCSWENWENHAIWFKLDMKRNFMHKTPEEKKNTLSPPCLLKILLCPPLSSQDFVIYFQLIICFCVFCFPATEMQHLKWWIIMLIPNISINSHFSPDTREVYQSLML